MTTRKTPYNHTIRQLTFIPVNNIDVHATQQPCNGKRRTAEEVVTRKQGHLKTRSEQQFSVSLHCKSIYFVWTLNMYNECILVNKAYEIKSIFKKKNLDHRWKTLASTTSGAARIVPRALTPRKCSTLAELTSLGLSCSPTSSEPSILRLRRLVLGSTCETNK